MIRSLPKVDNSVDVQVALRDLYDMRFGIFKHHGARKAKPLSSIAFHPMEDYTTGSRLHDTVLRYETARIKDTLNLDFLQFISMPPDVIEELCIAAGVIMERRIERDNEMDDLREALKNGKNIN